MPPNNSGLCFQYGGTASIDVSGKPRVQHANDVGSGVSISNRYSLDRDKPLEKLSPPTILKTCYDARVMRISQLAEIFNQGIAAEQRMQHLNR